MTIAAIIAASIAFTIHAPQFDHDPRAKCGQGDTLVARGTPVAHWEVTLLSPWRIVRDSATVARGDSIRPSYPTANEYSSRLVVLWWSKLGHPELTSCRRTYLVAPR